MHNTLNFKDKTASEIEHELTLIYGKSEREHLLEFRVHYNAKRCKAYLLKALQNPSIPPTLNYLFGEVDEHSLRLCPDFHILDYPLRKHYDLDFLDKRWSAFLAKDD